MVPAPTYSNVDALLNEDSVRIEQGYAPGIPQRMKIAAFLLMDARIHRPAAADIISNLQTLNEHSGSHLHFFMCGVSAYAPNSSKAIELGTINGATYYLNSKELYTFVREFECRIPGYNYDLGTELVIVDIEGEPRRRRLNLDSAIFIKVDRLVESEFSQDASALFNRIIRHAKNGGFNSAAGLKQALYAEFGINWFKALILSLFPASMGKLSLASSSLGGGVTR